MCVLIPEDQCRPYRLGYRQVSAPAPAPVRVPVSAPVQALVELQVVYNRELVAHPCPTGRHRELLWSMWLSSLSS